MNSFNGIDKYFISRYRTFMNFLPLEKRVGIPSDLKDLYQLYQQEIHETTLRNFKEFDDGKVYHLPKFQK